MRWGGHRQFVKCVRTVGASRVSSWSACPPLGWARSVRLFPCAPLGLGTVVVPFNQCVDPHAGLEGLCRGIGFF